MDLGILLTWAAIPVSLILTLILGYFVLQELRKLKAGQEIREEGPKWHASKAGTPTMGGIMFIIGSGITVFVLGWKQMLDGEFAHLYVYTFALCFGLIGFVDDYRKVRQHQNEGLTAKQKFLLQLGASVLFLCVMRFEGMLSNKLYIPFTSNFSITIPWVLYLVFAAFVIVGAVNAVNLTDGVDGLAASVTFVVMAFFTLVCVLWYLTPLALFPASLVGGLIAFLVYNRHPAKCFMGDTGSLFLGGAVAALGFATDMPIVLIPVGIIYIAETLSVIIQVGYFKATHGKRFFKMAPLHHHLELCGWSENKLVTIFSLITLLCCGVAMLGIIGRY